MGQPSKGDEVQYFIDFHCQKGTFLHVEHLWNHETQHEKVLGRSPSTLHKDTKLNINQTNCAESAIYCEPCMSAWCTSLTSQRKCVCKSNTVHFDLWLAELNFESNTVALHIKKPASDSLESTTFENMQSAKSGQISNNTKVGSTTEKIPQNRRGLDSLRNDKGRPNEMKVHPKALAGNTYWPCERSLQVIPSELCRRIPQLCQRTLSMNIHQM